MGNYILSFLMMGLRFWWGLYFVRYEFYYGMRLISVLILMRYEVYLDLELGLGWRKKEYVVLLGVVGIVLNGSEWVEKWKGKKGVWGRLGCDDDEDDDDDFWFLLVLDFFCFWCWWYYFIVFISLWLYLFFFVLN